MTANVKRFRIRTALTNQPRDAEVRARKLADAWEAQIYLLPRPGADRMLAHEEKMGSPVLFHVVSEHEALEQMMQHLKRYFRLRIEESGE